jgi:hypothetical protein
VRHDRDRRRHPQRRAGKERRGDDDAVAEVVDARADQDHESRASFVGAVRMQRMLVLRLLGFVLVLVVAVRVPPQHELLEREEGEEAGEHGSHDRRGVALLERVRQELEEDRAQQRADCERHDPRDPAPMQHERACSRDGREDAAGKRGDDDLHQSGQGEAGGAVLARRADRVTA